MADLLYQVTFPTQTLQVRSDVTPEIAEASLVAQVRTWIHENMVGYDVGGPVWTEVYRSETAQLLATEGKI